MFRIYEARSRQVAAPAVELVCCVILQGISVHEKKKETSVLWLRLELDTDPRYWWVQVTSVVRGVTRRVCLTCLMYCSVPGVCRSREAGDASPTFLLILQTCFFVCVCIV